MFWLRNKKINFLLQLLYLEACTIIEVPMCTFSAYALIMANMVHMGLDARKPVFGGLGTTQGQNSLHSAFVIRFLESTLCKLATGKISIH